MTVRSVCFTEQRFFFEPQYLTQMRLLKCCLHAVHMELLHPDALVVLWCHVFEVLHSSGPEASQRRPELREPGGFEKGSQGLTPTLIKRRETHTHNENGTSAVHAHSQCNPISLILSDHLLTHHRCRHSLGHDGLSHDGLSANTSRWLSERS